MKKCFPQSKKKNKGVHFAREAEMSNLFLDLRNTGGFPTSSKILDGAGFY